MFLYFNHIVWKRNAFKAEVWNLNTFEGSCKSRGHLQVIFKNTANLDLHLDIFYLILYLKSTHVFIVKILKNKL